MADQSPDPSEPRQPHNLQSLLIFAVDAAKGEDASHSSRFVPLNEERKRFLEEALKSMTLDVIELMHKNITILLRTESISVDSDIQEYLDAFEAILEHIDRSDTANDFHKIGGFAVFPPCLNSVHAPIRAAACNLLAELVQNNEFCQKAVHDSELLPVVITLLDRDPDEHVQVKALYGISCTIRQNNVALKDFINRGGISVLCRAFQRSNDRLRAKVAFLLTCLCSSEVSIVEELVRADLVPLLVSALAQEHSPSHEHVLQLLRDLAVANNEAANQCVDNRLSLKQILNAYMETLSDKDEEELTNCKDLLQLINKMQESSADTDR